MKVPVFIFLLFIATCIDARPSLNRPVHRYQFSNNNRTSLTDEQMRYFLVVFTFLIIEDVARTQEQERQARLRGFTRFPASRL